MVVAATIPRVELCGTPYEIGYQHGTALRSQIRNQLAVYRTIFRALAGLEWPQVLERAAVFQPAMQALAPALYAELEGIAAGANAGADPEEGEVKLIDIVALNARSEIALANDRGGLDDGCTSIAWALPDGRQVLAQNWDWTDDVGRNLALASIEQPGTGKPKIWMVIEPGIVGKIGFNSASVGVCLNAIRATALTPTLLPIHFLLRLALECTSVASILATIERLGGPASSQHILVADATSARGLEVSPRGTVALAPDAHGVVAHTNHFLQNRFVEEVPWLSGSPTRLTRAVDLVAEIKDQLTSADGKLDAEGVTPELLRARVFADKEGAPQAICCDMRNTDGRTVGTLFNIVMEFGVGREPKAEVLFGRPAAGKGASVYKMPW